MIICDRCGSHDRPAVECELTLSKPDKKKAGKHPMRAVGAIPFSIHLCEECIQSFMRELGKWLKGFKGNKLTESPMDHKLAGPGDEESL